MSIKALHYITGDTQKSGFRRIGGSPSFPADQLPYLNNGEPISERARVSSSGFRQGGGGIQLLSRVWEYETGDYGCPVIIQTNVAIGSGRAHGFSEYVMGETREIADIAEPWQVIQAAEKGSPMLDVDTFMGISGTDEIISEDESWEPEQEGTALSYGQTIEPEWLLTLLSHYWKQASIRAFSVDPPTPVQVFLGEFSDTFAEDNEETIRQAKIFFSDVIARGLPKQVQNIASMAAGVNGGDINTLYTALEFDISLNRDAENTFHAQRQRFPRAYRLNGAEKEFITAVHDGSMPEAAQRFFRRYRELMDQQELTETEVPFMADYRLLYDLYCLDRIVREKHEFIVKADLEKQFENSGKANDARICFLLLRDVRSYLEKDHKLNEIRKNLVSELLEPVESAVFQVMLENLKAENAGPFMLRRNDMLEFHRRTLYSAMDQQLEILTQIAVRDQLLAKAPQFVRVYPEVSIRNTDADKRNSQVLDALLKKVIHPLIEEDRDHERITNKYVDELRSDTFKNWILGTPETKNVFLAFLREEIKDPQLHFLLYGITNKYLPMEELLKVTFGHLAQNNATAGSFPSERQISIAQHGLSQLGRNNPDCAEAMNRYYLACFKEYMSGIQSIRKHDGTDLVEAFGKDNQTGKDTTGAMSLIFSEVGNERRLSSKEAQAVFDTFGGPQNRLARAGSVVQAYTEMLDNQRKRILDSGDMDAQDELVDWLIQMVNVAPFDIDTTGSIQDLFENATTGTRMKRTTADKIFNELMQHASLGSREIRQSFKSMVLSQFDAALAEQDNGILEWISGMIDASGKDFPLDTTDILKRVFEAGKEGERLDPSNVGTAFVTMKDNAEGIDTKVRRAFDDMLASRRTEALENQDRDAFQWMCDMVNKAPWKDAEWISEQHSENLIFLCDVHEKAGTEIDKTSLSMIKGWMEEGTVNAKGRDRLQKLCNDELMKGNREPAEMFSDFFQGINENSQALRDYLFEEAQTNLAEALESRNKGTYGQMISEAKAQTDRAGRKLDDLYEKVSSPVTQYLTDFFAKNTEIGPLIRELDDIPPDNRFYTEWRNRLSEQVNSQQVALFNSQPNLEKVLSLKEDILSFGNKTESALKSAYQLIERAKERFNDVESADETGAIASVGDTVNEFDRLLTGAADVRKKLCAVLAEQVPSTQDMRKISFRHALCSEVMKAELAARSGEKGGREDSSGPDWSRVLHHLFSKQEIEKATKKPYDPGNFPVLQRMLAVLENVRLMKAYGLRDNWANELVQTLHSDHDFHAYQSALARNRKKCEQYQLMFDSDGLVFDMNTVN